MARSLIVTGPPGCGKTLNAEKLKTHYGLEHVVDGWTLEDPVRFRGVLYLTNEHFATLVNEFQEAPIRMLNFNQAIKEMK